MRPSTLRRLASWILRWAERFYLLVHGWDRVEGETYVPPADYSFRRHDVYHRRHAVNAQHAVYGAQGQIGSMVRKMVRDSSAVSSAGDVMYGSAQETAGRTLVDHGTTGQEDRLMAQLRASVENPPGRQKIPTVKS